MRHDRAVIALSWQLFDPPLAYSGYVLGKTVRLVEWDLQESPTETNGDMVSVQVRTGQLTRSGVRECIARAYRLDSVKQVKQLAHWLTVGQRTFYERLDTKASLGTLNEGEIIVWTQVRA